MCRMWANRVYINPQGIASDRNPLVTCPDFDHISPTFGDHHDKYQVLVSAHTQHCLQLYIVQILTTYHLFANDSMASTIIQHI